MEPAVKDCAHWFGRNIGCTEAVRRPADGGNTLSLTAHAADYIGRSAASREAYGRPASAINSHP